MRSLFVQQRKNLRVAWRVGVSITVLSDQRTLKGVTRNVSVHGLLLFCEQKLELGTKVKLSMDLRSPGMAMKQIDWPMQVRGVVARNDFTSLNTVAVTYEAPNPEHIHVLRGAVFYQAMRLMQRISEFPAFKDLSELDQLALTTVCHEVRLRKGQALARLGDEATSLFLIKSGAVKLSAPSSDGQEGVAVEMAHAGQVFGEVSALLGLPHNLDVVAHADTELLAIPRDSLNFLRDLNPNLALALYEIFAAFMGRRLRKLTNRLFSPLNC